MSWPTAHPGPLPPAARWRGGEGAFTHPHSTFPRLLFRSCPGMHSLAQGLLMRTAFALFTILQMTMNLPAQTSAATASALSLAITFDPTKSATPLDGRLLLLLSTDPAEEPRFQINDSPKTQIVFGLDIENWKHGETRLMEATDAGIFGYPMRSLRDLKAGEYIVQALLDRYETFRRADGHVLKLPTDRGEGRQWNRAPGNLYSKPQKLRVDLSKSGRRAAALVLTEEIPPLQPPADTKYVKHIRLQSERLSTFWGRPIYLGAHVLLPEGFEANPNARYPLMVFHGHFPTNISGF